MSSYRAFDPARHPLQHVQEEFATHLHRTAPGDHVKLPDGTDIHKVDDHEYHLFNRAGRKIGKYTDSDKAAYHALDMSVRSHHHASMGGGKAYPSFEHFKKERHRD